MSGIHAVHPVDLEPFHHGGPSGRAEVARAIDEACRDSGFLQLTGHGVPVELCDQLLDRWAGFFDLAAEQKRRFVVEDVSANRGYTEVGKEGLAYSLGEESPPDLFEAFTYGREDATGDYYDRYRSFYAANVWPTEPPGLREAWVAYERAVSIVADTVLAAMAIALDLPEPWFADRCRRAIVTTRLLNYERAPGAVDPEPGQMRLGAHTDYGILTVLLADEVPGLQVYRGGAWHDVQTPRGTFTCNIGDMLARWTNDRWNSTLHRVVPPPADVDGVVRRRSVARFLDCEPDLVVECIPSCCSPEHPARYEPVVAGDWLIAKLMGGKTRELVELPVQS